MTDAVQEQKIEQMRIWTPQQNYLCSNPYECAQQREIIENPRNGFEFICSATEACRDGNFIIQLNNKPNKLDVIDYFAGILHKELYLQLKIHKE